MPVAGVPMLFGQYAVLAILIYGHLALWIAIFNRTHALRIPGHWIRVTEVTQVLAAVSLMVVIAQRYIANLSPDSELMKWRPDRLWLVPYGFLSLAFAVWTTAQWAHRRWYVQRPAQLVSNDTKIIHVARQLDRLPMRGWSTRLFACLPMNQMFDLCVTVKTITVPRLPGELDGLTITHLSDLHFTGKITRPFFDKVIDQVLSLAGDVIAITGDILEEERCFDWLQPTLGRLRARHGVYFVLGNHDRRLRNAERLRRELSDMGLVDLGRGTHDFTICGQTVQLAGNELPWFGPPAEPAMRTVSTGLRLLLSHSPDQIAWARRRDFDLMLAGHTHGGHIRFPIIGPIVCPSRYGVKFAAGVFFESPTLLHVSRGISGLDALRFNCPPEVTKLVLRSPSQLESGTGR